MIYLNVITSIIQSPEYVGSEPTDRATWWNLSLYCAAQENGGVIHGCADWGDRRWQQTCGVTLSEAEAVCDLWSWEDGNLIVWAYPVEKEQLVKEKREAGRAGGKVTSDAKTEAVRLNGAKGGRPRTKADGGQNQSKTPEKPSTNQSRTPENQSTNLSKTPEKPNGMEWNEMEWKRESRRASASEVESVYLDALPTENAVSLQILERTVQSMRSGWSVPLSYAERRAMLENASCLLGVTADGWATIKAYLAAKLPEGSPGYQPRSRLKLIENLPDVHGQAVDWQRKQRPASSAPPPPIKERTNISRAALAEVFANPPASG